MEDRQLGYMGYFDRESCDLDEFKVLTSQSLIGASVPLATSVEKNVPIYDMNVLRGHLDDPAKRRTLLSEWAWVLARSSGVIVLKGAYADTAPIDRASNVFNDIIREERAGNAGKGDHFAASGANDRIWNSLQKQCLKDPEGFVLYFGNTAIAAACEAWLGPNYQMTAQVNQVRPGGKAQSAHRDYHLGFMTQDQAACYPIHAHQVTATLTLQGGIAHCEMPLESGPTKLLPFSQLYGPGYLGFHEDDHRAYFENSYIQLPLSKGDAIFFNPALFHAAGENRSADISRMVNLLQISSAFGRAMETVDRQAMAEVILPALVQLRAAGRISEADAHAAMAACAEGYAFPTNLDTDPPVGGLAPASQADHLRAALESGQTAADLSQTLNALQVRQAS
ncbi:phytanoyl-CoA dioxygenase family protein [Marivita sp.]|uniref:phytanoyl-CoA dioxygenase family protein n=1 Tax=Marivita sp. TaxID=2003365 RepID=UPI003F6B71D2